MKGKLLKKIKRLIPNDFRDFLSILSFTGFLAIVLSYTFNISWLNENMNGIFLILGGLAFLGVGKVITAKKWVSNGIQQNEISQLIAIIFGASAVIIGSLLVGGVTISNKLFGYIGILAIVPAIYTLIDYIAKNKR